MRLFQKKQVTASDAAGVWSFAASNHSIDLEFRWYLRVGETSVYFGSLWEHLWRVLWIREAFRPVASALETYRSSQRAHRYL